MFRHAWHAILLQGERDHHLVVIVWFLFENFIKIVLIFSARAANREWMRMAAKRFSLQALSTSLILRPRTVMKWSFLHRPNSCSFIDLTHGTLRSPFSWPAFSQMSLCYFWAVLFRFQSAFNVGRIMWLIQQVGRNHIEFELKNCRLSSFFAYRPIESDAEWPVNHGY